MPEKDKKSKSGFQLFKNWNYKYKLVLMNESTFEEKLNLRLSRMNVFIAYVLIYLVTISLTILILWITPLKEFIPGYASVDKVKQVYENKVKLDSVIQRNITLENYVYSFQKHVLLEQDLEAFDSVSMDKNPKYDYENIQNKKSDEEKDFVNEWEEEVKYDLVYYSDGSNNEMYQFLFYPPLKGTITNGFNIKKKHYGIDIVAEKGQAVKATSDGIVILSSWTYETGYVIMIQHDQELVSVYKHNSKLIKEMGDVVKAGDPIAFIGNTGEFSSGPHLHVELWYKGSPVNPSEFISFN